MARLGAGGAEGAGEDGRQNFYNPLPIAYSPLPIPCSLTNDK
ncbi:hypothetical protein [Coleofasciculus sp.]